MRTIYFEKNIPRILAAKALKRVWPGVIWSPLSPIRRETLPDPPLPGGRWLRVRNRQCGICATDLSLLQVKADPAIAGAAVPGVQRVYLGHEAVGDVVEVGQGVTRFKVGDRVVIEARPFGSPNCHTQEIDPPCPPCAAGQSRLCENGSLGLGPVGLGGGWSDSYIAHESEVWPVPEDLTDDQASLIEPMSVGLHAVLRRPPAKGDQVLVIGAGIIGLVTLQALRAVQPGARVVILARYPHQAEAARSLGADEVITGGDTYERMAKLTGAKHYRAPMNRGMLLGGFDQVYDCVGSAASITDGLRWARALGTFVLVGTSFATMRLDISPVYHQEVDFLGANTFGMETWQGREAHTFDLVIKFLRQGKLRIDGLITHRFPIERLREALRVAQDKRSGAIKVTLTFPSVGGVAL